ncbi:MAG: hypothetical protein HC850_11010 [Rhodomicrobium sp.]|nr:hypothetical protein [Rhodomicrobium sp.]
MYGILAACIAVMAMFLGLFALSVPPEPQDLQNALQTEAAVEIVKTSAADKPAQ